MEKQITYKKQGDGRDSWRIDEIENESVINSYMVYEDPNKQSEALKNITDEQLYEEFKKRLGL